MGRTITSIKNTHFKANTMNSLQIKAIQDKAANLSCNLVAMLDNTVLCHRFTDDTYITWQVSYPSEGKADFYWGHYDMDLASAKESLLKRSHWDLVSC